MCNFAPYYKLGVETHAIFAICYLTLIIKHMKPNYIFETSWEVCNKIGGIYAVLSTRAQSMVEFVGENNVVFVGPDVWKETESIYFEPTKELEGFADYVKERFELQVRVGRWTVPGRPLAILVDFTPLYSKKDEIYGMMWESARVDSLHAYGDYDEASMFGYASGMVMQAFYDFYQLAGQKVVAHFNEWMTGFGLFYLNHFEPRIATLFTTHATTVGRSIAGNGKPLYDYMPGYFGDQMASELNVESKHSVEKRAAHLADCFTTVSEITDDECGQLLEIRSAEVTPNGFELDFVPKGKALTELAKRSRAKLLEVASKLLGYEVTKDAKLCAISGRYEYKNKGIDLYINALNKMNHNGSGQLVAFILVPGWQRGAKDLTQSGDCYTTHQLVEPWNDHVSNAFRFYGFNNSVDSRVKVIFVPAYLMGDDGVFNMSYYDLLAGFDFTVFPSYYEPWGYTPMESVAFAVPTITTNLSGFGRWVNAEGQNIELGVGVVKRGDHNFDAVSDEIVAQMEHIMTIADDAKQMKVVKTAAQAYAKKAQWKYFFKHYKVAYDIALKNKQKK